MDQTNDALSPEQQALVDIWEEHTRCEFEAHSVDDTMATMTESETELMHVHNIPTITGGMGHKKIHEFYSHYFIPQLPPDTETQLISRTVGNTQIVDELIFKFTHTIEMSWMLPGVKPTNKRVEVPLVAIIAFRDKKVVHEHIYWDQASVLLQLGLIEKDNLPINDSDSAKAVMQPNPEMFNHLIYKAQRKD